MMKDVKINSYQFLVLVTLFTIGSSILLVPSGLAQNAKQDAWIAAIIGTGIGLLVVWKEGYTLLGNILHCLMVGYKLQ